MAPTLYYQVRPKCGSNLTLAIDLNNPQGNLIVSTLTGPASDEQLWQIVTIVTPKQSYTSVLVSKLNGTVVYVPQNDSKAIQAPLDQVVSSVIDPGRCAWNLKGVASGNYGAFQLNGDNDQNLNVRGSGPYPPGTEVLAWKWSGGDPNEVWLCTPVIL